MKKPEMKKLDGKEVANDAFSQTAEAVTESANKTSPKTYSLPKRHQEYISAIAMQLGQARGKVVSASEALRMIVDQHSESAHS